MLTDTKDTEPVAVRVERSHYEALRERAESEQRTIKTVLGNILSEALGINSNDADDFKPDGDAGT